MLAFILVNKDKNVYTEVHYDKKIGYHGFTIEKDMVHKVNEEVFDVLNMLKLSYKRIFCGIKDGYEVFYDEISGLHHYLKNVKEDIEMFWKNKLATNHTILLKI